MLPPLELHQSAITFAATAIGAVSEAILHVTNPRLARLDSAVIRGAAPIQGPRAFEFCVPENVPFSVSPHAGVVRPGKVSCAVQ